MIILICVFLLLLGLLGCFVPVIPGPPLSFVALLLLTFFTGYQFDEDFLWQWGTIVVGVTFVDFWLKCICENFGGQKAINGTMIGLLVGIFVPIPMGFIIGPFVGAFVGAYMDEKDDLLKVLKIASGALIGCIGGVVLKLAVCLYLCYEFYALIFS